MSVFFTHFALSTHGQTKLTAEDDKPFIPNAVVVLRKGGEFEGHVSNIDEERPSHYLVHLENGGILKLKRGIVRKIDRYSDDELRYFARRREMPDTVDAHWAEYEKLRELGLNKYRDFHLLKILHIDPDNPDARNKLNYIRWGNSWVLRDHLFEAMGYQRDPVSPARILLPQDIEMGQREKQIKIQSAKFRNDIDRARRKVARNGDAELKAALAKVSGYLEVQPIYELIEKEVKSSAADSERIQMMYVEAIGQVKHSTAISKLAYIAVVHPSQLIREHAIVQLKKDHYDQAQVARTLFPYLRNYDYNTVICRAGFALGEIGHKSSIRPLIESLATTHKVAEAENPGQMQFGSSSLGGGGLNVGGNKGPKYVNVKNSPVHAALRRVVQSNVDYEYNKIAWIHWYIAQETITNIDLRYDD